MNRIMLVVGLLIGNVALAQTGDFALVDQDGVFHKMSYYDNEQIVLIAQDATSVFAEPNTDSRVFIVDPTASGNVKDYGYPVLVDDSQLVSSLLGIKNIGDVVTYDTATRTVVHLSPGAGPTVNYNIVDSVSYTNDVAPILAENCAVCHRQGGIAPFALDSAQMAKAWSPVIREALMTKRMPPGQVDPKHVGVFENGRVLPVEDIQTVVQWVNEGAAIDEGNDLLASLTWPESEWAYGEPDLIIELPPQEIPATGMIPYRYVSITLDNHTEDRWIRASQYLAGDPTVLHHTLHTITAPGDKRSGNLLGAVGGEGSVSDAPQITAYVPGVEPTMEPENTGSLLKAGSKVDFQLHYTTSGRETVDNSRIGVWFYEKGYVPEKRMSGNCACIFPPQWTEITPYDPAYKMTQSIVIPRDAEIYSFLPHMHFRGKSMRFTAVYPNGSEEELLNVANYDYAWQLSYTFKEPKVVPGGTEIRVDSVFDNSERNTANPDPSRSVPWGQMSEDEMFFGVTNWQYLEQ